MKKTLIATTLAVLASSALATTFTVDYHVDINRVYDFKTDTLVTNFLAGSPTFSGNVSISFDFDDQFRTVRETQTATHFGSQRSEVNSDFTRMIPTTFPGTDDSYNTADTVMLSADYGTSHVDRFSSTFLDREVTSAGTNVYELTTVLEDWGQTNSSMARTLNMGETDLITLLTAAVDSKNLAAFEESYATFRYVDGVLTYSQGTRWSGSGYVTGFSTNDPSVPEPGTILLLFLGFATWYLAAPSSPLNKNVKNT